MADHLYLIDDVDKLVFVFSVQQNGTWHFSRMAPFHKSQGKDNFVFLQAPVNSDTRWVLENQSSGAKGDVIGRPKDPGNGPAHQDRPSPPLGPWTVWNCKFTLTAQMPTFPSLNLPVIAEVSFATLHYHEEDMIGHLEVTVKDAPIVDDALEDILNRLREILQNLSRRPEMVLVIRSDARTASIPSVRHIRRYLNFIQQEVGSECVLVGRGSAIVLVVRGLLSRTILGIVQFVQRMLPSPWPQTIVSSFEEADAFLAPLVAEARSLAIVRPESLSDGLNPPAIVKPDSLSDGLNPPQKSVDPANILLKTTTQPTRPVTLPVVEQVSSVAAPPAEARGAKLEMCEDLGSNHGGPRGDRLEITLDPLASKSDSYFPWCHC
ncbi:unnamed protein product [Polarella glacialis]|uniref:Uncharacterized protein n=1 Tax=Polarella glacialis TaxID=89957 RepID=A0A813IY58_POLGL|nr:unnamed protein product [Polarella glacialis]